MAKFRKLPVVIEAVRVWRRFTVETLEGTMVVGAGNWLITGIEGEQYPCADSVFRRTYEPVDDEAEQMMGEVEESLDALAGDD